MGIDLKGRDTFVWAHTGVSSTQIQYSPNDSQVAHPIEGRYRTLHHTTLVLNFHNVWVTN